MTRNKPVASTHHPAPGERNVVHKGSLRCGPLRALPAVLDGLGADTDALLAEVVLTRSFIEDPENTVTFAGVGRLFSRAVKQTGCDHLGVLVGRPITLSALGAVGVLMQSSPDVGHALDVMRLHLHLHDQGARLSLVVDGKVVRLCYRILVTDVQAPEQLYMLAALAGHRLMLGLCGQAWRPIEVRLPFRRPRNAEPLREALGARLIFNCEQLEILFPASDLSRPLTTADPLLYRMMAERIEQLEAQQHRDLAGRVRDVMETLIFLGSSPSSIVAGRMGMSLRTLHRQLQSRGTSLQQIRDAVCADAACQLLSITDKSASEIASILGYSDPSSFTRAFRRWHGVAPGQWRARQREAT